MLKLHQFEPTGKGQEVRCVFCLQTWRSYPYKSECPRIPVYKCAYHELPAEAVTKYELEKMGLGDLIPHLPQPLGIWDNGERWRQIFDIHQSTGLETTAYPELHLTAKELKRLGITPRADMFTRIAKVDALGGWSSAKDWIALCNPRTMGYPIYGEEIERPLDQLTKDELYEAGYSTSKTKLPEPCAIFRLNQFRVEWLYHTDQCQFRRMSKKQRAALELAQAYARRTDDIEAALFYAYDRRADVTVRIKSPKMRGWICEAWIREHTDASNNTRKIVLGENRKDVFATIRDIAATNKAEIDWRRVSGDWELQRETYLGE